MLQDLKKFLLRGNVVDLAVAVIIGIAFGLVVASFVDDVLMQLIGAIFGEPDFSDLTFSVGDGVIRYGQFINAVINFVIIGTALFFVVRLIELLQRRRDAQEEPASSTSSRRSATSCGRSVAACDCAIEELPPAWHRPRREAARGRAPAAQCGLLCDIHPIEKEPTDRASREPERFTTHEQCPGSATELSPHRGPWLTVGGCRSAAAGIAARRSGRRSVSHRPSRNSVTTSCARATSRVSSCSCSRRPEDTTHVRFRVARSRR
jgi:large conductance mechanosensitive channel